MAFLYPKLFPEFFDCVERTTDDPSDIRIGDAQLQLYPTGMPLEKAMALIWKPKTFTVSGTCDYPYEDCIPGYAYSIWTASGQTRSLYPPTPQKMSELACNFSANYLAPATRVNYDCSGNADATNYEEFSFGFGGFSNKIYLFNDLYYIPTYYFFGGGGTLRDIGITKFYGNLTIDGIIFPAYAQETDAPISANIIITTSSERDTD